MVAPTPPLWRRAAWRLRHQLLARPTVASPQPAPTPIVVAGLFRTASGIGASARRCADGLERHGIDVIRVDLSARFGQVNLPDTCLRTSLPPARSGTLILHLNGPETERGLFDLNLFRHRTGWRVIGYWAWELPTPPAGWIDATRHLSEIWVPSTFVANAIAPIASAVRLRVKVVPHYVPVPSQSTPKRARDGLHLLTMADGLSSFTRKNPLAAIEAFRTAFPSDDHVRLTVKLRNADDLPASDPMRAQIEADPRITLVTQDLTSEELDALWRETDIFISLHRAEGFGLPVAEGMAHGLPCLSTDWSGSTDFAAPDRAVPVECDLIRVDDPAGIYPAGANWAEPSITAAAEALRQLAASPDDRSKLGKAAKAFVTHHLNGADYITALNRKQN